MRVLALDHGSVRCGVALSDPTGTLATPLEIVERPDTRRGTNQVVALAAEVGAERVVVGLPLTPRGDEGEQAEAARAFAERLAHRVAVSVELYDERFTTLQARRIGGAAALDSRAAAHLLESYLASRTEPEPDPAQVGDASGRSASTLARSAEAAGV